jgi:hypothetical protein
MTSTYENIRENNYTLDYKNYFAYKKYDENYTTSTEEKYLTSVDCTMYVSGVQKTDSGDRSNIERCFDYSFVKPYLITPLLDLFISSEDVLFNKLNEYLTTAKNYTFTKFLLYIFSKLITNLSTINNIDYDSTTLNNIQEYIYSNYYNKKINFYTIDNVTYDFTSTDSTVIETITSNTNANCVYDLYKLGFFNYYNHVIDTLTETCDDKFKYYCVKLKNGAINILHYYLSTEILYFFIASKNISNYYNNSNNSCSNSIENNISSSDSTQTCSDSCTTLQKDIVTFTNFMSKLITKINIYDELINQKNYNSISQYDIIKTKDDSINEVSQNNIQIEGTLLTLKEKNDNINKIVNKNKFKRLLFAIFIILYFGLNALLITINFKQYEVLVGNLLILMIMTLYLFIIKLKKNMF